MCSPTSGSFETLGTFSTFCKYARRPQSEASSFGAPPERLGEFSSPSETLQTFDVVSRSCLRSCGTPSARRRPVELLLNVPTGSPCHSPSLRSGGLGTHENRRFWALLRRSSKCCRLFLFFFELGVGLRVETFTPQALGPTLWATISHAAGGPRSGSGS